MAVEQSDFLKRYLTEKPDPNLFSEVFKIKEELSLIKDEFYNFIDNNYSDLETIDPVVKYKDLNLRKNIDTTWKGVKLKTLSSVTKNTLFLNKFKDTLRITNYPSTTTILLNISRGYYTSTYHKDVPLALAVYFRLSPKNNSIVKFDFPQYKTQDYLTDFGDFTFFQSHTLHCNITEGPDEIKGIFVGFLNK